MVRRGGLGGRLARRVLDLWLRMSELAYCTVDVGLTKEHFVASAFGDERVGSLEWSGTRREEDIDWDLDRWISCELSWRFENF